MVASTIHALRQSLLRSIVRATLAVALALVLATVHAVALAHILAIAQALATLRTHDCSCGRIMDIFVVISASSLFSGVCSSAGVDNLDASLLSCGSLAASTSAM